VIGLVLDAAEAPRIELLVHDRTIDGKPWIEIVRGTDVPRMAATGSTCAASSCSRRRSAVSSHARSAAGRDRARGRPAALEP